MPSGPACMSTLSDCAKTASPVATFERPGAGAAADNEQPSLALRLEADRGARRQLDPFEHEVRVGCQKDPFVREPPRFRASVGRPRVCHGDGICNVKVTLAAEIEHAERDIAALLDLRNHKTRTDRVDGTGGNKNHVARQHRPPRDKIRDRAIVDSLAQLPGSELLLQAEGDSGSGCGTQDVPGFGLAACQADRLRVRIVRMNLNGKGLAREQQFEQERRIGGLTAGSLVPDFADQTAAVMVCPAPWPEIGDTPRLLHGLRARAFDRHKVSPEVKGSKVTPAAKPLGGCELGRMRECHRALCRSLARNRYLNRPSFLTR